MKNLYCYKGCSGREGNIYDGRPLEFGSRCFSPGEYYWLEPDDPFFAQHPDLMLELVEEPPSCEGVTTRSGLEQKVNGLRDWLATADSELHWDDALELIGPCIQELSDAATDHLGLSDPPDLTLADEWGAKQAMNHLLKQTVGASQTDQPPKPKQGTGNRGKRVNARMLEKMLKDTQAGTCDCHGWTGKQWAGFIKCSEPSVVATQTWKDLKTSRDKLKAELAMDRHRRPKGSDQRKRKNQG